MSHKSNIVVKDAKTEWDYAQPEFYKFNEDSLFLVEFILQLKESENIKSILDVGAGCGVIGLELVQKLKNQPVTLLALERLEEFSPYLQENFKVVKRQMNTSTGVDFCVGNLEERIWGKFDLVVSNPPYFLPTEGRRSHCLLRQNCRSFEYSDPLVFLASLRSHLAPDGVGYFLGRSQLWEKRFHLSPVIRRAEVGIYRVFCDSN